MQPSLTDVAQTYDLPYAQPSGVQRASRGVGAADAAERAERARFRGSDLRAAGARVGPGSCLGSLALSDTEDLRIRCNKAGRRQGQGRRVWPTPGNGMAPTGFYLRAAVIDRGNGLGMVVTNAAEARGGDH